MSESVNKQKSFCDNVDTVLELVNKIATEKNIDLDGQIDGADINRVLLCSSREKANALAESANAIKDDELLPLYANLNMLVLFVLETCGNMGAIEEASNLSTKMIEVFESVEMPEEAAGIKAEQAKLLRK